MAGGLTDDQRTLAAAIIDPLIVANSFFSADLTDRARDEAAAEIEPQTVNVALNEALVRRGDKITEEQLEVIDEYGLRNARPDVARLGGWLFLSILVVGLGLAWIWRFRRELWHRTNALLLIGLLVVGTTVLLKATADRPGLQFVIPTAAVGILLAILLDAGVATVVTIVIALARRGDERDRQRARVRDVHPRRRAGRASSRSAGATGSRSSSRPASSSRSRTSSSSRRSPCSDSTTSTGCLQLVGASIASAAGSAVAAVGTFAVLGNLFGFMTVFQLLELANPSQPLLRRLLVETPGTYHHSLMVGNLAERAAEAIGADPLLTRVAAYYHDIGKLANPLAFIENQAGGENIHDQLDPEVSAQILKQHVADGIDIAYQSKLPKALIAFIPQHHGTAIMSYFYARAKEARRRRRSAASQTEEGAKAAATVDERKFRHAGPKPQSREAALIMLADGVEASVRSLSSRDEAAIRAMVARIIEERLNDGQFDECDLTLRDIERIREAFVTQLLGMYHQRVAYPAEQGGRDRVPARNGDRHRRVRQRCVYVSPWRIDVTVRDGVCTDRHRWPCCVGRSRGRSTAAGAPEPASIGLILVRRRRAGRAEPDPHGRRGPDRRALVPAAAGRRPSAARGRAWRRLRARSDRRRSSSRPARRHLGDIVVSVERAIEQAAAGSWRPDRRRPLVARRRAAPPRHPRHAPRLRLGPRRARGGSRDAGPRAAPPRRGPLTVATGRATRSRTPVGPGLARE